MIGKYWKVGHSESWLSDFHPWSHNCFKYHTCHVSFWFHFFFIRSLHVCILSNASNTNEICSGFILPSDDLLIDQHGSTWYDQKFDEKHSYSLPRKTPQILRSIKYLHAQCGQGGARRWYSSPLLYEDFSLRVSNHSFTSNRIQELNTYASHIQNL
jgi:hypothetical protein